MKLEYFNVNEMYTFDITVYEEDNTKYVFGDSCVSIDVSGILFAKSCRQALEKVYDFIGVEFGKTICHPNVRHFSTECMPYIAEENPYITGFVKS